MDLIFVTLRPFAVYNNQGCPHCRPLSLPLSHAGEVVECYPGVEALGGASRSHPGARVSLSREYSVLLYLYLYLHLYSLLYCTHLYLLVRW